jgi:G3E family GTPase
MARDLSPMIPITVFTGFLGAGKTSIILSLLPQLPKDYKVVLLKNEFGDVKGMVPSRSKNSNISISITHSGQ